MSGLGERLRPDRRELGCRGVAVRRASQHPAGHLPIHRGHVLGVDEHVGADPDDERYDEASPFVRRDADVERLLHVGHRLAATLRDERSRHVARALEGFDDRFERRGKRVQRHNGAATVWLEAQRVLAHDESMRSVAHAECRRGAIPDGAARRCLPCLGA